jgi:hypothetical protein
MNNGIPSLGVCFLIMGAGLLLIAWGFLSDPIKYQRGLRKKLSLLFSDGLEGPGSSMRTVFVGLVALVIGANVALSYFAPGLVIGSFLVCWVALFTLALVALYRKYNPPT